MNPMSNLKYDFSIQNKRLCWRYRPEFLSSCTSAQEIDSGEEEVTAVENIHAVANAYEMEIISYLPTKNVQILKSVCKDWLELLTSSHFVRLHLSRSIRSRIRVLMTKILFPTIIEYNNYDQGNCEQIAYPPQFSYHTKIFSSTNGLALLFEFDKVGLFNPSTGKCFQVQLCPHPHKLFVQLYPCFGDLGGGEYVLVMGILISGSGFETWVYKFTWGSDTMNRSCSTQNTLLRPDYQFLEDKGTFLRGVVYWPVRYGYVNRCYTILAYHVGEKKHMEISPPQQHNFRLGLFVDGCSLLATFVNSKNVAVLWVMKEDRWTKYATIGPGNDFPRVDPLGFFPNGDLIMDVDRKRLMKYSFNHQEPTLLMDYGRIRMGQVIMCADGLLSPDCIIN